MCPSLREPGAYGVVWRCAKCRLIIGKMPTSYGHLTRSSYGRLGIPRWRLRRVIHLIKKRGRLGPRDRLTIYDDGSVFDASGEDVGSIYEDSREG
jgi:hypothetical protein